jgi:hypothetical protein
MKEYTELMKILKKTGKITLILKPMKLPHIVGKGITHTFGNEDVGCICIRSEEQGVEVYCGCHGYMVKGIQEMEE